MILKKWKLCWACEARAQPKFWLFGNLVPDLVVEIKSKTDRVSKLEDQLKLFLELGAKVAILINSDELIVNLYDPDGKITLLTEDDQLTLTELFPGWEIAISELSPPVFE